MLPATWSAWRSPDRTWMAAVATAAAVGLLAVVPTPLVPLARSYRDLCDRYPVIALLTNHLPALPGALLLTLAAAALINGGAMGGTQLVRTLHFNCRLDGCARPMPARLARAGVRLGLGDRLTYLGEPGLAACCYGFLRPRVAVTAGLLAHLDDEELTAVLAHEGHHLRRRDPLRYLVFHAVAAAAFMFPVAPAVRRRLEVRTELAADRAALAVAPRGALAAALLAALAGAETPIIGAARLSATEARIAHLSGTPAVPAIPARTVVASLGLLAVIAGVAANFAASAHVVEMVCRLCADVS